MWKRRKQQPVNTEELLQTQTDHVARSLLDAVREVKHEQKRMRHAEERGDDPSRDPHAILEVGMREATKTAARCGNAFEGLLAKAVEDMLAKTFRALRDPLGAIGIVSFAAVNEAAQLGEDQDRAVDAVLAGVRRFARRAGVPAETAVTIATGSTIRGTRGYDTWAGFKTRV